MLLGGVLVGWVLGLAEARGGFVIRPYLFSEAGRGIGVFWRYSQDMKQISKRVRLTRNGQYRAFAPVSFATGLHRAHLDVPCGEEGHAYWVEGMEKPAAIPLLPCAQSERARFALISDTQEFPQKARKTIEELARTDEPLVINGGDIVQTGDDYADWVSYFWAMQPVGGTRVTVPVVGNHDYRYEEDPTMWRYFFGESANAWRYALDLGPVRVIVFNSNFEDNPSLVLGQLEWMEAELAKPARWKVVAMHHPPYSTGYNQVPLAPKKEHLRLREHYVPLFERHGVDLVLSGHTHLFERSAKDAIQYLVAGAAGGKMGLGGAFNPFSLFAKRVRTVSHFEADADRLRAWTTNQQGGVEDDFELRK